MTNNTELVRGLLALLLSPQASHDADDGPWKVGNCYLIRTVTMTWTGRVIAVHPTELVLEDAAWIADTGRFSEATTEDSLNEVEPVSGPVVIGRQAVVDARSWTTPLPRAVK